MRILFLSALFLPLLLSIEAFAQCGAKRYCKEMHTCAEAYFHMSNCGLSRLDRDRDGIPCEKTCGKSLKTMAARINAQPFTGETALGLFSDSNKSRPSFTTASCGTKRTCRQMTSCEEARFHLNSCGVRSLDGNRDGIPCNGLCN